MLKRCKIFEIQREIDFERIMRTYFTAEHAFSLNVDDSSRLRAAILQPAE